MKIVSNFHDIYDYMMMYGQDDKLTYQRINNHGININSNQIQLPHSDGILSYAMDTPDLSYFYPEHAKHISHLTSLFQGKYIPSHSLTHVYAIINGAIYHDMYLNSLSPNTEKNVTPERLFELAQQHHAKLPRYAKVPAKGTYNEWIRQKIDRWANDVEHKNWAEYYMPFHVEYKTPIFFITKPENYGDCRVFKDLPLHYLGFESLKPEAERIYQDIAYCLGNVITNRNEPPDAISDKNKIEQAGFDYVTSFRG